MSFTTATSDAIPRLVLRGQQRIAEILTSDSDLESMLAELCDTVEKVLEGVHCSVMLYEPDAGRLKLGAAPTLPDSFCEAIRRVDVGPEGGSCGAAVFDGQVTLVRDIESDPRWRGLRDAALEHGLRSCWSLPLRAVGDGGDEIRRIVGTLDFYFFEVGAGDGETVAALQMAGELATSVLSSGQARERLHRRTHFDALTGLPNRAFFLTKLRELVEERKEKPSRFAVVVVDIDKLKHINDTLGFMMGDHVLQALGQRLVRVVREDDVVARTGGDEFAMLIQNLRQDEDLTEVANKIKRGVNTPYDFDGHDLFVTGSIGLSVFPWDGDQAQLLLRNAETALDQAKELGGSDFQLFRPTMVRDKPTFESWWRSTKLGSELRHVLEKNELELHYQLKYGSQNQRICGAEALIRWRHPTEGIISPAKFIPMAEKTGLILDIGEWVMQTACKQNKQWQDSGLATMPISVNVSPQQFRHGNLVATIRKVLEATGLEARYLELEITERVAMEERGRNLGRLEELHELGLPISVDDFGTGYSSLSYLTRFPLDTLKIDRSFVINIGSEPESEAIIRAVISMAKTLSLEVVAEGVETEEQYRFLCEHECDIIQGYYFSRPCSSDEVTKVLIKRS